MTQESAGYRHRRGQRTDIFITALRDEAESRFAQLHGEAATLRARLGDSAFTDVEYDGLVAGLACSTLMTVRPLPRYLRAATAELVGVETEIRSRHVKVKGPAGMKQMRLDCAVVDSLVEVLGGCLYEPGTYLPALTDIACGLEGLSLTFSRDIAREADSNGVISPEAVRRISEKVQLATGARVSSSNARRIELIGLLERAASLGSSLTLASSEIREARISKTDRRGADLVPLNPDKQFQLAGKLDPSHPIYKTGYVIGSLANTIRPPDERSKRAIRLVTNEP